MYPGHRVYTYIPATPGNALTAIAPGAVGALSGSDPRPLADVVALGDGMRASSPRGAGMERGAMNIGVAAIMLAVLEAYPFDQSVVGLTAGILTPIWAIWLASRSRRVFSDETPAG